MPVRIVPLHSFENIILLVSYSMAFQVGLYERIIILPHHCPAHPAGGNAQGSAEIFVVTEGLQFHCLIAPDKHIIHSAK